MLVALNLGCTPCCAPVQRFSTDAAAAYMCTARDCLCTGTVFFNLFLFSRFTHSLSVCVIRRRRFNIYFGCLPKNKMLLRFFFSSFLDSYSSLFFSLCLFAVGGEWCAISRILELRILPRFVYISWQTHTHIQITPQCMWANIRDVQYTFRIQHVCAVYTA